MDNINEQIKNNMKIELYNHQNELIGILLNFPFEENNQQLEESITYNHDEVYERNKDRFESMNCFQKYKSYTNTNNIPTFCR